MRSLLHFLIENLDRNRIIRILFPFDHFEDTIFVNECITRSALHFLIENFDPVKKSNYSNLVFLSTIFEIRYDVCKRIYYALGYIFN